MGTLEQKRRTVIQNGMVFLEDGEFHPVELAMEDGCITEVAEHVADDAAKVIDARGCRVVPGLVDIHIHGSAGSDFSDGKEESVRTIAAFLASQGITSFLGTSMSYDEPVLSHIMETARYVMEHPVEDQAVLCGINMEGPFFSKAKKGAQNEMYLVDPDYAFFTRLYQKSGGVIRLVDIAPELPGAMDFIRQASRDCTVSIAHTTAGFETAAAAFSAGARHVTHLFNAMPPFHHRDPGVVGAAFDQASHVELISDGIHLHPAVVRSVFAMFGDDRVCLISDAIRACGMPEGNYTLGGQDVTVKNGKALLKDGTIAGSATNLAECMRRAVKFGVPLKSAIKAATCNPAKAAGIYHECGSITRGKRADVLLLDSDLMPKTIVIGGKVWGSHEDYLRKRL